MEQTPPRRSRLANVGFAALKFAGLLVYTILFAELFLRVAIGQAILPRYVTGTPYGMRGNIPHASFWQHTQEITVNFHINGQGMRDDRDYPFQKPRGVCRIAMFGDSYFEGFELALKDTLATRLQQELSRRGYRIEVLNFAVSGFGTAEDILTYEKYARRFDPDVLLFEWNFTDPDDNVRSGLFRLKDGQLIQTADKYLPSIGTQDMLMKSAVYRFVADNSQLYNFARERAASLAKRLVKGANAQAAGDDADVAGMNASTSALPSAYALALSGALLKKVDMEARREGRKFIALEIPLPVSRTHFAPIGPLLPADTQAQIELIQPTPALTAAARPDRKLYWETGAHHLSPAGVNVVISAAIDRIAAAPQLVHCHS